MAINLGDPHAYQHLQLICEAYEKAAYSGNDRNGFLAVAEAPLSAMDHLLDGVDTILARTRHQPPSSSSTGRTSDPNGVPKGNAPAGGPGPTQTQEIDPPASVQEGIVPKRRDSIELDVDLMDVLFPNGNQDSGISNYLRDCLGCDLRLQFDWQLRPLNLLGPIRNIVASLKATLASFQAHIDPLKSLEGICNLLNAFQPICIPDLVMILTSLKMLMKRYTTNTFQIRMDWMSLFGPILSAVLGGVVDLLQGGLDIAVAPIDCVLASLSTANQAERAVRDIVAQTEQLLKGDFTMDKQFEAGLIHKNIKWVPDTESADLGELEVRTDPSVSQAATGTNVISGFYFDGNMSLDQALQNPDFMRGTFIEKIMVPVNEAKRWLQDTLASLTKALDSLSRLTSGGVSLNLQNIGAILFVLDTISLVITIVRLRQRGGQVTDWCEWMGQNPGEVNAALRGRYGAEVARMDNGNLALRRGPDTVGEIYTCPNQRHDDQNQILRSWADRLARDSNA